MTPLLAAVKLNYLELGSRPAISNTAEDHMAVIDLALAQLPGEYVESLEILVRTDSAGATHGESGRARPLWCVRQPRVR